MKESRAQREVVKRVRWHFMQPEPKSLGEGQVIQYGSRDTYWGVFKWRHKGSLEVDWGYPDFSPRVPVFRYGSSVR